MIKKLSSETLREEGGWSLSRRPGAEGAGSVLMLAPVLDHPSPAELERLHHEFALRTELDPSFACRPLALTTHEGRMTLVLEDPGGVPLDRLLGEPLPLSTFLRLGLGLSEALGKAHARGLIHKDIKPGHALVDAATGDTHLLGFGIASRLLRERQALDPPEVIAGTLPYMAPEQTGRMNRSIDSRGDLYALGVIFYEMLTGSRPFVAADPMEWVHCHVAKQPIPPGEMRELPGPISDMVLKLLAKTAEERYQTAAGLSADLRRALSEWESGEHITHFPLGTCDVSDRLLIPERLYGRERQARALLGAFGRVVADGTPALMLVTGYSGVGKTSLVNELHKAIVPPRGLFAAGKFDQYRRDTPYDIFAQAFRGLVRQILVSSEEEVDRWRSVLREALGPNGQLVVDLVPELEFVLGKQPPVPELSTPEAQNRFQSVFLRFIGAFARPEHPLALFLDDLQWLDPASLELLASLLTRGGLRHLLVVGAYRDNEVSPCHPLTLTLGAIRNAGAEIGELVLEPLSRSHVGQLLADTLLCEPSRVAALAQLIHDKTAGNPFFVRQFLTALHDEGLLSFDREQAAWTWDLERVREKGFTDNVIDLLVGKLKRLPAATQAALQSLACLGSGARAGTLALIHGGEETELHANLWEAVRAGLLFRVGDRYQFAHDRVQEAAYSLIPERRRAETHLSIARLLLAHRTEAEVEETLFELTSQYNRGVEQISDAGERAVLCGLNARAGRRAKHALAHTAARTYLSQAQALLPPDAWEQQFEETFTLILELSEAEYLAGDPERAETLFQQLLERAHTDADRARVHSLRASLYQVTGHRVEDCVSAALDGLRCLGVTFPESDEDIQAAFQAGLEEVSALIGDRRIADLVDAPVCHDPRVKAMLVLAVGMAPPVYTIRPKLLPLLMLKEVTLSLKHGHTEESCLGYAHYALLLAGVFEDYASAFEFSQVSLRLNEKFESTRFRGALLQQFAGTTNLWRRHIATGRPLLEEGFVACLNVGDFVYAGFNGTVYIWHLVEEGETLENVRAALEKHCAFAKQIDSQALHLLFRQYGQFIACLEGRTPDPTSFDDEDFSEADALEYLAKAGYNVGIAYPLVLKQFLAFTFERYDEALEWASRAAAWQHLFKGFAFDAPHHFFHALAAAAVYPDAPAPQRAELDRTLDEKLKKLKLWAENCPENYLSRFALASAEAARVRGGDLESVMRLYEQAIRSAHENGFVQYEALAQELAGKFYLKQGFEKIAETYLRAARYGYLRWGALGKVRQLDRRHPDLEQKSPSSPTATIDATMEQLDLTTVVKAAQAVSGEIVLGALIEKLLAIAVEHAGAERGLLLLPGEADYAVRAEATTACERVEVTLRQAEMRPEDLPESILRYALRTGQSVILNDASTSELFGGDAYVRARRARSVLCLPLMRQGRMAGVLYLENHLACGVFTRDRIAMLEILASQAAISLDNARLFSDLKDERARLDAVIQQVPAGLVIAEAPSGRILLGNDRLQQILGSFQPAERIEDYSYVGFHADGRRYAPSDWPLARSIRQGEVVNGEEAELLRADGSRVWLTQHSAPIRDAAGRITAGVVVLLDVTEHKRAQERFSKAFHDSPSAMGIVRMKNGILVDVNESLVGLLGFSREELIGRGANELGVVGAEERERVQKALLEQGSVRDMELTLRTRSAKARVVSASLGVIELDGQKCVLVSCLDLTERKHVEEQLHHAQKMEAIGLLAGGIAHDFNNLLTAIHGYSALSLHALKESHPVHGFVLEILKAAERAAGLTRQLLAYSRKQVIQPRVWSLGEIVREMLGMLERVLGEHISLVAALASEPCLVRMDRGQLEQILLNLAINARDAMPDGGTLTLATGSIILDRPYLGTHLDARAGPHVMLAVTDTGAGMEPEVQTRLFEPFFTTKEVGKGTGLGLSVVYGIVQQNGGGISVYSEPGRGTTFRIYLPQLVDKTEDVRDLPRPQHLADYRGSETLLLVEDDEGVRKFSRHVLEAQGYGVLEAVSGIDALRILDNTTLPIQLVVTDVVMPDMGGMALSRRLRERDPSLPILYISGYTEQGVLNGDRADDGELFLQKPFSPFELVRVVRRALDTRAAH